MASAVVIAMTCVCLCRLLQGSCVQGQGTTLTITPSNTNTSVFLGGEVEQRCAVTSGEDATIEWLHNGSVVPTLNGHLLLLMADYTHIGEYFCQATLTDTGSVIGPVSGGYLHVLDPTRITAPPIQYALLGSSTTLQCETDLDPDATINWLRSNYPIAAGTFTIDDVSLKNESSYTCRVTVTRGGADASTNRNVELRVIVPPVIVSRPDNYTVFQGPSPLSLVVAFQSNLFENTTVAWLRDSDSVPENRIQTVSVNSSHGTTTLSFPSTSRSDTGTYWVAIENNSPIIPGEMREVEIHFQLRIAILPTLPTELQVADDSDPTTARITWSLTNQNADDAADSLTLTVAPGLILGEDDRDYPLDGTATEAVVMVFPGVEYTATLAAHNQDGHRITDPVEFQTPAREPSVSSLEITRVDQTTFQATLNVDYTGGGAITHFTVAFRKSGSDDDFNSLGDAPASRASPQSVLVWNGAITSAEFSSLESYEFDIAVSNEGGLSTAPDLIQETIVLPGAPLQPSLVSSTTTSLTIAVQLSQVGTPPILYVRLEINGPAGFSMQRNATGDFILSGETVQLTMGGLSEGTEYRVEASAVNRAGAGPSSEALFSTNSVSSLPLWVIVVIIVGSVVIAVVVLLTVVCVGCCCIRRRRRNNSGKKTFYAESNTYVNTTSEEKKLDASHEILKRQHKGFTALSAGPLTPRSPTTIATPATVISAEDLDGPLGSKFKFETSSNNSDDSDTTFPRYTYRVSPSPGESAPSYTVKTGSCTSDTFLSPPPHPSYATDV